MAFGRLGAAGTGFGRLGSTGSGGSVVAAAVGGGALLTGEANGFATDFTHATDAERVAVKTAGAVVASTVDGFYQNAGTSPKMVYDVAGTLGWSPHNTCLQSQTFDNASWAKNASTVSANAIAAPNSLNEADALIPNAGSVNSFLNLDLTTVSGTTYTVSVYAKNGTLGNNWIELLLSPYSFFFNLATGVNNVTGSPISVTGTAVGNGWYRLTLTFTAAAPSTPLYLAARPTNAQTNVAGNGTSPALYLWGAQVNRGSVATDYLPTTTAVRYGLALDYDPVTHAAQGLLCEPAATNGQLRSAEFDNASWFKNLCTVSANATAAPDGTTTADAPIPNAGSGRPYVNAVSTTTAAAVTTWSIFAKNGTLGNNWFEAAIGPVTVWFNLATGVKGTSVGGPISSAITSVGNGWYRLTITYTAAGASTTSYLCFDDADNFASCTGNGTSPAAYLWGAQMEAGTVATSYIPTTSATVTRAADNYRTTPAAIGYSATMGSWWAEHYTRAGQIEGVIIGQNSGANPIFHGGDHYYALEEGAALYNIIGSGATGNVNRVACAFQASDRALSAKGFAADVDTGATTNLLNPTFVQFGQGVGHLPLNGRIRKVRYLPRRPSNAELATMST